MPRTTLPRGIYAIVDSSAARPPLELVGAFVRGGAAVVQLRLKQAGAGEVVKVAREGRERRRSRICAMRLTRKRRRARWSRRSDETRDWDHTGCRTHRAAAGPARDASLRTENRLCGRGVGGGRPAADPALQRGR